MTKPSKERQRVNAYAKGAVRSIDVVLTAAEKLRLSDDETLALVRAYRSQIKAMTDAGDMAQPFIDRAVNAALKSLLTGE